MELYIDGFTCLFDYVVQTGEWYCYGTIQNSQGSQDIVFASGKYLEDCEINTKDAILEYWKEVHDYI